MRRREDPEKEEETITQPSEEKTEPRTTERLHQQFLTKSFEFHVQFGTTITGKGFKAPGSVMRLLMTNVSEALAQAAVTDPQQPMALGSTILSWLDFFFVARSGIAESWNLGSLPRPRPAVASRSWGTVLWGVRPGGDAMPVWRRLR